MSREPTSPRAHEPGRHQLGVRVDRHEGPHVAVAENTLLVLRDVLRFGVAELPNLVDLYPLAGERHEVLIRVLGAHPGKVHQELGDRVPGHPGHAGGGADRVAFHQGGHDGGTVGVAEDVCHTEHYA